MKNNGLFIIVSGLFFSNAAGKFEIARKIHLYSGEFLPLRVIESLGHSRLYEINTDEHIIIIIIIIVIMSHYLYKHNVITLTLPKTPCNIDHMTNQKLPEHVPLSV